MNYQSGDKLKNRYLSNDAFTSLTNKLGGRSITSLGNRRKNSYKIANQGINLFEYKSIIYKTFITILLLTICLYIIPQTRYMLHGYVAQSLDKQNENTDLSRSMLIDDFYNIAPVFLKTDQFIAKQKDVYVENGLYAYDFVTNNLMGVTTENSSSTINIKLFSDAGFKNNFLVEQDNVVDFASDVDLTASSSLSDATTTSVVLGVSVKESNKNYQSYVFEGLGYGQLVAKVPPKTIVKKDSYVYVRTVDGLKPFAKIINVDEDNKSTFTIIYAQLIVSPQNVYKVTFK
jgi:hypothetical protein